MKTPQHNYLGFLKDNPTGLYKVTSRRIAPESILASECLVKQLYNLRTFATGKLLDIGCSTKPYKPIFDSTVTHYWGVDVPFSFHTKSFVDAFARGEHLPFTNNSFNTIICTEVLEHVPDPQTCLLEIARVLVQEGHAIISMPFMYRIHEAPYDFFRYTPYSIALMAENAGLTVLSVHHRGGYVTVLSDVIIKGLSLIFGSVRSILSLKRAPLIDLYYHVIKRTFLTAIQKFLWMLLRNESLASDRFTLGYVWVLRKSSTRKTDNP